ncbi:MULTISPECIES: restriction endonuclease subunit S [Streptococcus]|jgi:type Ic restriction-modification system, hsdS subunit|uniref:Restriction endonuclease subunit S n=2 Tax=Streptococcus TaxID=1301 RepID=A0A7T2ZY11_STROR|nr:MULTISPECIES: restriction endonuclease subunit S [Streptococcus]EFA25058.1 type I restriction modification DNA specificity domain protein [Streptococcus sp. M143]QPT02618.1 restriction endonuclease subunit S [Streptococcus oralis]RSJ95296.1 putative type-1 restriction enzyme specificity protein [Streptococcus cristatus]CAK1608251.1 restriction endonuclease subunit S [Streptococcus oralis subsp. dentisani]
MSKNSIPKIRFNNFKAFWVEKKIADIVKISAGGDVDKERLKQSGKYPVIANALTNKGIVGFYDDYKVKAPAVTVTGRGDVGYAVARHENFTPVVRLLTLQSDSIDMDYLENQINSMKILNESTGVPQLTAPQLGNYKVYRPEIDEQSAIGSLFRTLDDLLASYKDNLTNYQSLKATMLSKMFPKAGQTIPEIRLDGFERKWEKKKLIDLVSPVSRKVKKPSDPYYRLSIRSHAKGTFKQFVDDPKKIAMDNLFEVKENDLVVNITFAWEHAIAVASKEDDGLLVSHRFPTFVIDKSDKNFINIYIKREEFRQKLDLLSPGGAGRNRVLNVKDFIKIQMIVPELEEQQAIGSYFSNLDNLINSCQEKITQLETLKKKLLQDMFI